MAPKVVLTGSTGYVGGDALYALYKAHPEYDYTLVVRDESRGKLIAEKYPNAKFAYGPLDGAEAERAFAAADIIVHTADSSDNVPAATSIRKAAAAGHTADKPVCWIHICGTGILLWYDVQHARYGQGPLLDQKYDDIADIDRILTLPDTAFHRNVDKIVLGANEEPGIFTAIVGPPNIYGRGRGPVNQRSMQIYDVTRVALEKGFAPMVGPGLAEWDQVHIDDLSAFLVTLVEAAQDPAKNRDPELFGARAYYFLEAGPYCWGDVARWIAEEAHRQGYFPEPTTKSVTMEELLSWGGDTGSAGLNSKSTASRARKYLGWQPHERSLKDEIPDIVASEAARLGLKPAK